MILRGLLHLIVLYLCSTKWKRQTSLGLELLSPEPAPSPAQARAPASSPPVAVPVYRPELELYYRSQLLAPAAQLNQLQYSSYLAQLAALARVQRGPASPASVSPPSPVSSPPPSDCTTITLTQGTKTRCSN